MKLTAVALLLAPQSWFFTALDLRTGEPRQGRAAYIGTLGGLVRIADTP